MDSKLDISLLYDFYGGLMPAAQQRVVELYVNDDLSLSEVADIMGISRQGVRDSLNRAAVKLREYERRLGLLKEYERRRAEAQEIAAAARRIAAVSDDSEIRALCDTILQITGESDHHIEREA